jgi:hypothetical protein
MTKNSFDHAIIALIACACFMGAYLLVSSLGL